MHTPESIHEMNQQIELHAHFIASIKVELAKVIAGQQYMDDRLLIGLLSNGHVLLEGVPGLAKTLTIESQAQAVNGQFSRIQFTPDLLPADVISTMIYNQPKNEFLVRKGPIFANFILADEINRAPAKLQSALLEAMQEKQVTIGETTYPLPSPFLLLGTQNPLEQEGTYALPEAQVDRFMLKVMVGYPDKQEEQLIIRQQVLGMELPTTQPVVDVSEILTARNLVRKVYMDEKIENYILDLVFATRYPEQYGISKLKPMIGYGGSPRASINFSLAAKAVAFLHKRSYVIPDDLKAIAKDVLRHRIGLTYEAEAENTTTESFFDTMLATIQVP
jgi:MoxR-like ATPase